MRRWKRAEVEFMFCHAADGAEYIAERLGRSVHSVECRASRYGLSLRKRWFCPNCGQPSYSPPSRQGWCQTCAVDLSREKAAEKNHAIRAEIAAEKARIRAAKRERQRIYSMNDRRKNELRRLRAECEQIEK